MTERQNITAVDCRAMATSLRQKNASDRTTTENYVLVMQLERAAREIEHLESLVEGYKRICASV